MSVRCAVLEFYRADPCAGVDRHAQSMSRGAASSPCARRPGRCCSPAATGTAMTQPAPRTAPPVAAQRRAAAADDQPDRIPAALSAGLRRRLRERERPRAQGRDALSGRRQLSHGLDGRSRAVRAASDAPRRAVMRSEAGSCHEAARSRMSSTCAASLPRAGVGRSRGAAAVPAARLDGRRRVVPVPRRRARADAGTSSRPTCAASAASAWQPHGYWFQDYVADLDALLRALAPGDAVRSRRPQPRRQHRDDLRRRAAGARARRVVALDGFGIPVEDADARAGEAREVARCAARPAGVQALREPRRRRRPAAEEQSAAAARQGRVPRGVLGARRCRTAARELRSDPRHKLPFPTVYRMEEIDGDVARRSPRRRCGSRPPNRTSRAGSTGDGDGRDGRDRARMRTCRTRDARDRRRRRPHAASRPAATPWRAIVERSRGVIAAHERCRAVRTRRGAYALLLRADAGVGRQLDRDEARARARASGRVQRAAHAGSRSSRCSSCWRSRGGCRWPRAWIADRRSPGCSRRRSTSARRRWRSPAAARAARRCWCSRCRSGRC